MKDGSDRSRIVGIAVGCAALLGGVMAVAVGTPEPVTVQVADNDPSAPGASALARRAARLGAWRTFGSPLGGRKDGAARRFVRPPAIECEERSEASSIGS